MLGAVGAVLVAAGLTQVVLVATAVALASVALIFDLAASRLRLPRYGRQVNEDWMSMYRGWVYGGGYGLQLGAGLTTIVTAALVYLVFALCLLSASWTAGGALGAVFGLSRGLALLSVRHVDDTEGLVAFHRRLQRIAPLARRGDGRRRGRGDRRGCRRPRHRLSGPRSPQGWGLVADSAAWPPSLPTGSR